MNFLIKNKNVINILLFLFELVDAAINFSINVLSTDGFHIFASHNIVTFVILAILIIVHIWLQSLIRNGAAPGKRYLLKAFKENGGYDKAVDEMKVCIANHDFKSFKEVVKAINYIER